MPMQEHSHNADLLIVGGGVAGLNAALSAAEKGASVIIMDKAVIERSGHTAGGIDHFGAFLYSALLPVVSCVWIIWKSYLLMPRA